MRQIALLFTSLCCLCLAPFPVFSMSQHFSLDYFGGVLDDDGDEDDGDSNNDDEDEAFMMSSSQNDVIEL